MMICNSKRIDITRGDIRIRNMTESDYSIMLKCLTDDRVLEFYDKRYDFDKLKLYCSKCMNIHITELFFEYKGNAIGYGQIYKLYGELYKEYNYCKDEKIVFATDQFIGEPEYWNKAIGIKYMQIVIDFLKVAENADVVLLDQTKII